MARPTKMTPDILEKLRHAFDIGATDEEACTSAEISTTTLYNYQIANPEFLEEKTSRKEKPILRARQVVVDSLEDPKNAQWFLERKRKDEFSLRSENDVRVKEFPEPLLSKANVYSHNSSEETSETE